MGLHVKRMGVMRILDTTGVVDRYVFHYLDKMKEVVDRLMIFCANATDDATVDRLRDYTEYLFKYDNINFSDGCFVTECSYERMREFDEVLFFDDTCYGPFSSLEGLFEKAEQLRLDYWGMTKKYESVMPDGMPVAAALQDYFIVLRRKVVHSDFFAQYWHGVRNAGTVVEALVRALEYGGFYGDACMDTSAFGGRFPDENYDPGIWYAYDLLKYGKCPFVRTGALDNTYFLPGGDEVPEKTFTYIKNHTDYDTSLIWEHLLRTKNILDIKTSLHLERVLPNEVRDGFNLDLQTISAAVIVHLYYDDLLPECMDYIEEIPDTFDIYIISANKILISEAKKQIIARGLSNCYVRDKNNQGRDFSALLVACRDILMKYEYLCFVHDKKSHAHSPVPSGKTWFYNLWSCMLNSNGFIKNIIETFENNPCLGLLVPPEPCHSEAIAGIGWTWANDFDITRELLRKLEIEVPLDRDLHPITLGTAFWCRTKALKPLFEQQYEYDDFPEEPMAIDGTICHALERIFGYVAQGMGYYTEYVMPPEFAGLRMAKMTTYLTQTMTIMRDMNIWDRRDGGVVFRVDKEKRRYEYTDYLRTFAYRHGTVYIYGAGKYGQSCCGFLQAQGVQIAAFIVSSRGSNQENLMGIPVRLLSEIEIEEENAADTAIIVALKPIYRAEVIPKLEKLGDVDLAYYPNLG